MRQAVDTQPVTGIGGVLLAGGRARRLGGRDKGLLLIGETPLAAICAARLAAQTVEMRIVANRHRDDYEKLGYPVVADVISGFAGPLAGIHAGMTAATTEWLLSAPCDSPFFPKDLAAQLFAAATAAAAEVAVATAGGRAQPVFMLAKRELRDTLADFLAGGDGKIANWYRQRKFVEVPFADAAAFDNINTPEDLANAVERLRVV